MSISLRANADGSGTLLNGSTPVMEVSAAGVVSLPNIAAGSSENQPVNFGQFDKSLGANGWQKLPSGLIIQWGQQKASTANDIITLPIAMPTRILGVFSQSISNGLPNVLNHWDTSYLSTTGFRLLQGYSVNNNGLSGYTRSWLAIGC